MSAAALPLSWSPLKWNGVKKKVQRNEARCKNRRSPLTDCGNWLSRQPTSFNYWCGRRWWRQAGINTTGANGAPEQKPKGLPDRDRLTELVGKANAGDEAALASLRLFLDENPEVWQKVGDLSLHVQENHIRRISDGSRLATESLRKKAEWFRKSLAGPNPSSLERVAIENVVAAWFERHEVELKYPAGFGKELAMARFVVQLRNSVHRRYDSAMKSLLLIREKMPAIDAANRQHLRKKGKIVQFPAKEVS